MHVCVYIYIYISALSQAEELESRRLQSLQRDDAPNQPRKINWRQRLAAWPPWC